VATISHEVRIRYAADITPRHRLTFHSRKFAIVGIVNTNEANEELVLNCIERPT
jgi:head-tail adaptor